ncbi:MAG: hypothetical protein UIH41_02350 [Treponemataceae bacterium]|nr:hypothetical protein [Treponemataceae bacterium]
MKKIVALLLAVSMLFAFVACDTGNGGSGGTGTGSEGGNTGSGSTGGNGSSSTGGTGSGSTGGNGSSSTGGTGSGSTEGNISYVGTWTGPMGPVTVSITLNDDDTLVAYKSDEGFSKSNWNVTNSGVTITIGEVSLSGKLDNGKLEVAYMGQDIPLKKVDTTAYVGTWKDENQVLSITLNAVGTVSATNSKEGDTTGFWTVTNSGFIMWLDVGDKCPEEGFPGNLQGDELEVNYMGNEISLTKK